MMRKGIDWELLIHMGVTLSIPTLLKQAKIDQWLVDVISPVILPFMDSPAMVFYRHRAVDLPAQAGLHQLSRRGHALCRAAAAVDRRRHEPMDYRHDHSDRFGSMVFPLSGRLAYARLLHHRRQRIFLSAHVPDQSVYASPISIALLVAIPYWRFLG